jgi:hypothetical protein
MKPGEILKKYHRLINIFTAPLIPIIIYLALYLPAKHNLSSLADKYKKYTAILNEAGIYYNPSSQRLSQETPSLAKRLSQSEEMLSQNETEAINNISKLCYKLNIELASITPTRKEIALDANNKEITVGERKVSKITIKLSLITNFSNLIKFIEETRKIKNIIILNKMAITKSDTLATASDRLKVELEVSAFNLSGINL